MSAEAESGPSRPRIGPGAVIKGILGVQIALAGLLFAGDLGGVWPRLDFGPRAPQIDQPVRPGDQTRRYRPADRPAAPPGRPFPAVTEMPERLSFAPASLDGDPVLRLTGQIAPGDAERFADWLDAATEEPSALILNSPGGSVADALAIGQRIRDAGLDTRMVPGDICLSACPYVLAGGVTRRVDDAALVGVHQHYFGENTVQPAFMAVEDIQRGQGEVMAYLDRMGVDPLLMQPALMTPPDEIYILMPEELMRYRLAFDGT
ncbi:hypothetical protein DXV76_10265 [Rhodobacteraceae bacterium CCMM004]|nr:hypothetical protein DXV76_10265 [Rhodobacteraceae bacterium CCMM004]